MFNCCSVTVWYLKNENECNDAVNAVLSYSSFFKSVYIIDNSAVDHSDFAARIKNAVYVFNNGNLGIATALNQGCELAKKAGFEWCMTMDQDSVFSAGQLSIYLRLAERNMSDPTIKSFSIRQKEPRGQAGSLPEWIKLKILSPIRKWLVKNFLPMRKLKIFIIRRRRKNREFLPRMEFVNMAIASANIISLPAWEEVGKFDDKLFIDEVDNDFCIRLKLKGYNILLFNTCYVDHELGKRFFSIFPKINYESSFRLFYIFRNLMIEDKRYGKLPFAKNYKREIFCYFRDYCVLNMRAIKNLGIFIRACKEYKKFVKDGLFSTAS